MHSGQCMHHPHKVKKKKQCNTSAGWEEGWNGRNLWERVKVRFKHYFFAFLNNNQPYTAACSRIVFVSIWSLLPWTSRHHCHSLAVQVSMSTYELTTAANTPNWLLSTAEDCMGWEELRTMSVFSIITSNTTA